MKIRLLKETKVGKKKFPVEEELTVIYELGVKLVKSKRAVEIKETKADKVFKTLRDGSI